MDHTKYISSIAPCRRVGHDGMHHFFGYYNKSNWDKSGTRLLANRVPFMTAPLAPDLSAEVGFFDLADDEKFVSIDTTTTWNWQMGCQLQWLDGRDGSYCIYNTRATTANGPYPGFQSTVCNVDTGEKTHFPVPITVAAPNSRYALGINYSRLFITHETIGYWEHSPPAVPRAPVDDGIYFLDLDTGDYRLAVSLSQLSQFHPVQSMEKAIHWISHVEINPSSSRVLFLHRWTERVEDETCFLHRLITMDPDGSDLRLLEDSDHPLPQLAADFDPNAVGTFDYEKSEYQISHPLWCDDQRIIVWSPHQGEIHYHLYRDEDAATVQVVGRDILTENGHMTYSPINKRWLLSDTYPDSETNERLLILFDMDNGVCHKLGSFYTDPVLKKVNRCDLHPRWSRDGRQVCIDSVHESERQLYVIDVSHIVG